jgi:phosphohistidine phosphatase SixA
MSTSKAAPRGSKAAGNAAPAAPAPAAPPPVERFVVLLRHGIAEDPVDGRKDEDRSLTSEGHARMKQSSRGLERVLPKAQAIIASPLLRAVQTALWVSKAYRSRIAVQTSDALAPGASTKDFLALLASTPARRIVVVGHEPVLTACMRALTGLPSTPGLELKKGGCYGVRILPDGTGALEWLLAPKVLRELGEEM